VDLSLVKTASASTVTVGGQVTFTMVATNNGPGPASGVLISDSLPSGLELVSVGASQGSCAGTSCSIGTLAQGGSAAMKLVANTPSAGTYVNTASVSSSVEDPVPGNGTSSASVTVTSPEGPPAELPPPAPGEVNLGATGGSGQCVALKGGTGCEPLTADQQIDIDAINYLDPGTGKIDITSVVGLGAFYGGKFNLHDLPNGGARSTAAAASKPILVVKLVGGNFGQQCSTKNRSLAALGSTSAQAKKPPVRRPWGKGKGRFRTRGRYASGEVRGTNWVTEDFCDGTRVHVVTGIVQVWDFVLKRLTLVHPGESYFASAKKKNK
jgi:uncharacterized repeat protein (TIGR01451 family)